MLAFDLDRDVRTLAAMASNLTPYLYEDEMYGHLAGDLPRLTLGGLLMRLYRLRRLEQALSAEQATQVQDAQINFEAERSAWTVHYENKIQHEINVRLNVFERFLKDYGDDAAARTADYPNQAERRSIIEHLRTEAQKYDLWSEEFEAQLKELDQKLQRVFRQGRFIYSDDRLADVYPQDQFWWLYGYLPEESHQK